MVLMFLYSFDKNAGTSNSVLRIVGRILNYSPVVLFCLQYFLDWSEILFVFVYLTLLLSSICLYVLFPKQFTLLEQKEKVQGKGNQECSGRFDLSAGIIMCALAIAAGSVSIYSYEHWGFVLFIGAVGGALLFLALNMISREAQVNVKKLFPYYFAFALLTVGVLGHINHYTRPGPDQKGQVIDLKFKKSRRSKRYYCTIQKENLEVLELQIPYDFYKEISEGDDVTYFSGKGGLGISYSCFVAHSLEEKP